MSAISDSSFTGQRGAERGQEETGSLRSMHIHSCLSNSLLVSFNFNDAESIATLFKYEYASYRYSNAREGAVIHRRPLLVSVVGQGRSIPLRSADDLPPKTIKAEGIG